MGHLSFIDILRSRALYESDRLAFIFIKDGETESDSLTYQRLDQQAQAIAAQVQSLIMTGERALLLYPPGLEFISAFFGCLYAGIVAVPAYPPRRDRSLDRLRAIVADSQAKIVLTTTQMLSNLEQQFPEALELKNLFWVATDTITTGTAQEWQQPAVTSDTLAFLQYTSGSTAMPKGVMVSHGNLLHNSELIHKCFEHTPKSHGAIWLPPYHDMGLIGGLLQPVYGGFPVTLMSPVEFLQKPIRWLQAISRYKATTSGGPNFAYDLCVSKITPEQCQNLDLSSWQVAFNGAETIRAQTLEHFAATFAPYGFRREAFYPCYGMAETTLIVSGGLKTAPPVISCVEAAALKQNRVVAASEERSQTVVSLGKAGLNHKVAIANPETLTRCLPNQVGEIWVSGSSVTQGYWNKPEETEKTFHAYLADTKEGPFVRTGDLGFVHNGELFVTGRLKDLIIIRGRNYYPQDIELTVERSHPALRPACGAAFAVEVNGVERLGVAQEVQRTYLRNLDVDEVVGAIRKAVSQEHELQLYAVVLLLTGSIPKTSSGKIQRYACRAGFLDGSLDVVGKWTGNPQQIDLDQLRAEVESLWKHVQKADTRNGFLNGRSASVTEEEIQAWLIAHIALYLKVPPDEIDICESFAYYGLDSSVAIVTTGELMDWLGCELEPTLFWEYPNIETLAQYLAKEYRLQSRVQSEV